MSKKTSAVVAVTSVKREDQSEFEKLCENFKALLEHFQMLSSVVSQHLKMMDC